MLTHRGKRVTSPQARAEDLVLTTITQHADALLRTARRHSLCADDASDAYQRGLEIFLRNAARIEPDRAVSWLHVVIKHEAFAVRRARQKHVSMDDFDGDSVECVHTPAPDERMLAFEDVTRAAEALQGLKPQEVRALWMRMEGRTYKEIAAELGWTYTKVNRCVTEGRRAFLTRYAGIEAGEECRRFEPAISAFVDGELRGADAGALRRHLRGCGGCRGTLRSLRSGQRSLQAVLPVALVVGATDGGDSVLGVFVRVYETVAHNVQERAVTLAAKAQFAVEATGAAKVAAVAGAAAAVAGGGAVTAERVVTETPRPAARAAVRGAPAVPKAVAAARISAPSSVAARAAPIVVRTTPKRAPQRGEDAPEAAEFTFERVAAERRPAPAPKQSNASRSGAEFDLEP
jgi:RNA polymerase sigma factor (sigma-70 family)